MSEGTGSSAGVSRGAIAALLLLVALGLFAGLGASDLQEPDEGRYADVASTMARTGRWLTPELNGIGYFSKPPLAFWAGALSVRCFGPVEWALRLPPALAGFATLLLVLHWTAAVRGRRAALIACSFLASMPLFNLLSRVVLVDGMLTLWITLAAYAGFRAVVREPTGDSAPAAAEAPASRRSTALFWTACALAFLTKGPIGVVLPVAAVGTYALMARRVSRWRDFVRPLDLVLFLVIAIPWTVAVCVANPEYFRQFFLEQNVERFTTGGEFRRQKAFWYYLPVIVLGALPWSGMLPLAGRAAFRRGVLRGGESLALYLVGATTVWFAVLCVAQSKLAYYLLPLLPLLAIGLGCWVESRIRDSRAPWLDGRFPRAMLWTLGGLFVGLAVVGFLLDAGYFADGFQRLAATQSERTGARLRQFMLASSLPTALGCLGLGAGLLAALRLVRSARPWHAIVSVALGMSALLASLPFAMGGLAPVISIRPLAESIEKFRVPGQPVIDFGRYLRGLPFYLQESVILWEAREGEFGQVLEAGAYDGRCLQKDPQLLRDWVDRPLGALLVVDDEEDLRDFSELSGFATELLAAQGEWRLARSGPELRIPNWTPRVETEPDGP